MNIFCDRLKEERNLLKLNQTDFGKIGGVGQVAQSKYENGTRVPDANYLTAIAAAGADVTYILTGVRSADCNPDTIAQEVAGVMYVVESVIRKEKLNIQPKPKAEILYAAYKDSTPEERRMMLKALEEGVYMLPISIAKLFRFDVR